MVNSESTQPDVGCFAPPPVSCEFASHSVFPAEFGPLSVTATERRARLLAAAHAAASWGRARSARWADTPDDIQAPVHQTLADVRVPVDVRVEIAQPRLEPERRAPEGQALTALAARQVASKKPTPRRTARAGAFVQPVTALSSRLLPYVAVATMILAVGASARAYWVKVAAAPKTGIAVLDSLPAGSEVRVDGKVIGATPLTATLPAGAHTIEFRFRKKTKTMQLTVAAGGRSAELVDWTRKPTGQLQVTSKPAGAQVLVDGTPRGVAPITLDDLAAGPHVVALESPSGSVKRSITVTAGQLAQVSEAIFPGWVTVLAPFEIAISEGTRPIRLDDRSQVMLPPGPHELRFENRALGYQEVRRVEIESGEHAQISVVPLRSTLSVRASAPADVWLDGVAVGQTPLVDVPVELGTRDIVLKSATGNRRFTLTITTKPAALDVDFSKP